MAIKKKDEVERRLNNQNTSNQAGWYSRDDVNQYINNVNNGVDNGSVSSISSGYHSKKEIDEYINGRRSFNAPEKGYTMRDWKRDRAVANYKQKQEQQRQNTRNTQASRAIELATDYIDMANSYLQSGRGDEKTREALAKQYNGIGNYLKTWGDSIDEDTLKKINSALEGVNAYVDPTNADQAYKNGSISLQEYNQLTNAFKTPFASGKNQYKGYGNIGNSLDNVAGVANSIAAQAKSAYENGEDLSRFPTAIQFQQYAKPQEYTADNYDDYWERINALANAKEWTPELKEEAKSILEAAGGGAHNQRFVNELNNKLKNGEITAEEYDERVKTLTSLQNKYNSRATSFMGGAMEGVGAESLMRLLTQGDNTVANDVRNRLQQDVAYGANNNAGSYAAGDMLGSLALMTVLGGATGGIGSAVSAGVGGTLGSILGGAASSAATFGTSNAIKGLGEAAETGDWGKYAANIGIGSAAGAIGGAASAAVGGAMNNAAVNFFKNHPDLQGNKFANVLASGIANGTSSAAFAAGSQGVSEGYRAATDKNYKFDAGNFAKGMAEMFAYSFISSMLKGADSTNWQYYSGENTEASQNARPQSEYFDDCNTVEEVKAKQRQLMRQYHPDQMGGDATVSAAINSQADAVIAWMKQNATVEAYTNMNEAKAAAESPEATENDIVVYEEAKNEFKATLVDFLATAEASGADLSEVKPVIAAGLEEMGIESADIVPVDTTAQPEVKAPELTEIAAKTDRLPTTANTDQAVLDKVAKNYIKADMPALAEAITANAEPQGEVALMDYVDDMTAVYGAVSSQLQNNETIDQKAVLSLGEKNGGELKLNDVQILAATDAAISDHFKTVVKTNKEAGILQKPAVNATIEPTKGEVNNVRTETQLQREVRPESHTESNTGRNEWWVNRSESEGKTGSNAQDVAWRETSLRQITGNKRTPATRIKLANASEVNGSPELRSIVRANTKAGAETYLYSGKATRTTQSGAIVGANAFNYGGKIYLPTDVSAERAAVLSRHELHEVLETRDDGFKQLNRSEVSRVNNMLPKRMAPSGTEKTSLDRLSDMYAIMYETSAPDLSDTEIYDEMIHDIYAGLDVFESMGGAEELLGKEFVSDIKQVQSALKRNADQFIANQGKAIKDMTEAEAYAEATHSPVNFSVELAPEISARSLKEAEKYKKDMELYKGTEEKLADLVDHIKSVTMDENGNIKTDVNGNPLIPDERFISNNIFSNASYLKDAEPTTECFRQLVYFSFQQKVSDILKRPLTEKEAIIANQAVAEIGIEAPCLYCYSLMDRKAKEAYKIKYVDERDAFLELFDSEYDGNKEKFAKDRNKNFDRYLNLYMTRELDPSIEGTSNSRNPVNDQKKARVKLWMDVYQYLYNEDAGVISLGDIRNWDSDQVLSQEYKNIPDSKIRALKQAELKDLQYWVQSSSQAKKRIEYAAYSNVKRNGKDLPGILTWKQTVIDALNAEYGLRWYSHAEYHPAFTIDNIQQIIDASIRGLKGLMYTKEIEAVKIVADSGMNVNVSCFMKLDKDGKTYVCDDALGADWEEVKKLRAEHPGVGSVMVVTNDDQLFWALTQDWIDCVIPLHKVRSGDEFMKEFGLSNYTPYQEEKLTDKQLYEKFIADICNAKNIADEKQRNKLKSSNKVMLPKDHNNSYEQYAAEVAKRGLTPRFNNILQQILAGKEYNGVKVTTDMYMKLVNETRMAMNEIQPLRPKFDFGAAETAIDSLAEKGYYNYFKPSSQWIKPNGEKVSMTADDWAMQAAEDIRKGTPISKLGYGRDLAWDASKGKYIETAAEAKAAGLGGVHDSVGFSTEISTEAVQKALKKKDEEYLAAVNTGDMTTAQRMVDEAAKEAGYTIKTYHGTYDFGKTVFDRFDGAMFLTDRSSVARNFSGGQAVRNIADNFNPQTSPISEVLDYAKHNTYVGEDIREATIEDIDEIIERVTPDKAIIKKYGQDIYDKDVVRYGIANDIKKDFLSGTKYYYMPYNSIAHVRGFANLSVFPEKTLRDFVAEYPSHNSNSGGGVYGLYLHPGNMLEINVNGNYYTDVPIPNVLKEYATIDEIRRGYASSDQILRMAAEAGYDTVKYADMREGGDYGNAGVSNVYATLNAPENVKSADPVTYDDNGNVIPLSERFNPANEDIRFSTEISKGTIEDALRQYAPTFYHKAQRVLEDSKQEKFSANSVVPMLKGKGVKDDEIKWSGIETYLDGKKSVSKADLLEYMKDNQLEITEKVLTAGDEKTYVSDGGYDEVTRAEIQMEAERWREDMGYSDYYIRSYDNSLEVTFIDEDGAVEETATYFPTDNQGDTRWAQYKLENGKNYREILFKMPESDYTNQAMNVHWGEDNKGVLAHARVQDFDNADGKVLFIEEIQSDWHNAGQKAGYNKADFATDKTKWNEELNNIHKELDKLDEWHDKHRRDFAEIESRISSETNLAAWAVYASLIGKADEYGVSAEHADTIRSHATAKELKLYDEIKSNVLKENTLRNRASSLREKLDNAQYVPDAPFKTNYTDFVLKDLLRMAAEGGYDYLAWTNSEIQSRRWSDKYAEGYRIEYDQEIPKFLKKYGKQWGAELTTTKILEGYGEFDNEWDVQAIPINDVMKESVLYAGQSMFSVQVSPEAVKKAYLAYYDPQRWMADRTGDPDKKPMPLSDIIAKIRHDYKINITTGHIRGSGVRGTYNLQNKGIRTRLVNNLPTISHELGHAIDDRADLTKNIPKDVKNELQKCLDDSQRLGQIGQYPKNEIPSEGFAEYIRKYLQNREVAEHDYPEITDYIKKSMSGKDLALLNALADEVNAYYALDADTATSSIRLRENKAADFRTVGEKLADKSADWYQAWIDANHPFKQIDKAVGSNTYLYATNSAYSDAVAGEIILGDLTDPDGQYVAPGLSAAVANINTRDKVEYREWGEYLVMRHATEFMYGDEGNVRRVFADDRKNNPKFFQKRIDELEAKYPAFKDSAESLYEWYDNVIRTWGIPSGLINAESYEELHQKYPNYVPFQRVNEKGTAGAAYAKRGFANQTSPIKRAKGSGLDIVHPMDSMISNIVTYVNAATRNIVMKKLRDTAVNLGVDAAFMEKIPTPMIPKTFSTAAVKGKVADQVKDLYTQGKINEDTVDALTSALDNIDDILTQFSRGRAHGDTVTVLIDGQPEFWKINDPNLLTAVSNLAPTKLSGVLEAYAKTTRFLTANITGNNFVWSIFSNAPRDLGTFIGYFKDKKQLPKAIASIGRAYVNSFKESVGSKKVDPIYKEYLAMGGGHASAYSADIDIAKKARKKMTSNKFQRVTSMINPLNVVSFVTDTIEQGPRFATYRMCRMGGMTPQEAFYEAMDITVNFRKSGTRSREINKVVPFFNASVQGVDKFARYFSGADVPPEKRASVIRGRVGLYVAASALLAGLFYAINNSDEQKKKEYQQLSTYTKNSFWCIPLGDGKYFTIPKPRELTVLTSLFETIMEYGIGGNKHAFDDFYEYAVDNFFPSVVSDLFEIPSNIAEKGVGDGLKESLMGALGSMGLIGIGVNVAANRDFLGRSIESSSLQDLEAKQRYTATTSKMAYWLGQAFNLSPQVIDYIGNNVLGYIWKLPKALFPVGEENRDWSLGIASSYVKDNQYSTDLTNWMYDEAEKSAMEASSNPEDMDLKVKAKIDDSMKTFFSRFNNLNRNDNNPEKQRGTRQIVLDMLLAHQKQIESGTYSEVQEKAYAAAKAANDMSLLPAVMQTYIKDADKVQYNLNDSEYLEYQTKYNELYWSYVEQNIDLADDLDGRLDILKIADQNARQGAANYMLKMLGGNTGVSYVQAEAQEERGEEWSRTTLYNTIKESSIGADMTSDQEDQVATWIKHYLNGDDDSWMTTAEEKNIAIEDAMLFELAMRMYNTGSSGYDGIDKWNALDNLDDFTDEEKEILWAAYGVSDTTFADYKDSKKYQKTLENREKNAQAAEEKAKAEAEAEAAAKARAEAKMPAPPTQEELMSQQQAETIPEQTPEQTPTNEGYVSTPNSSVLAGYEYDYASGTLYVTLNSGRRYSYHISPETYEEFKNADSQGSYWSTHIK